jgi:hypothetical protein
MGSIEMLGEGMHTVALFTPTYWYSQAVHDISLSLSDTALLISWLRDMGMVLLFVLALSSVALLIGRHRAQSSEAGGNPAADVEL